MKAWNKNSGQNVFMTYTLIELFRVVVMMRGSHKLLLLNDWGRWYYHWSSMGRVAISHRVPPGAKLAAPLPPHHAVLSAAC
jgi:hypothetical protein